MLTKKQLDDIHSLQQICEEAENIKLKLNWDTLKSRPADEKNDYFHYDQSGKLIGYLALYNFGGPVEICGMVHPDHRRKGIFCSLFNEAAKQLTEANKLLINAPATSESAKGFIKSLPCTYSFSEYQMKRHKSASIGANNPEVTMRKAESSDLDFINHLDTVCFNIPKEEAEAFNNNTNFDCENEKTFIIEYKRVKSGKIRIQTEEDAAWIYGFAVDPLFQRKGIGRSALTNVVNLQHSRGINWVHLEVAAENDHALSLYKSCGFEPYGTQDYYEFN
ncbi:MULTISPECIES: GNAT family N-acetyltransferase [unclassified Cytobacillus]|uniref:GNAT family N-acetyltransferase n=1 Tax=unclassified Cytobacillus TaxID=2675268 RepID=UPI0013FCACCF|nr:GNAT family N-acetyltransferase [Cytobacillus sp. AMY 15.2]KAF0816251.1 acetyltransferase, GNAT family [Bacillus sp. ZZV12-4809]MCM3091096.1 GNAT family N-acetyltransferase [Cytobacillus sp. AMY 15.2]